MQSFSLLFDTNDIEHDGRMLGRARDPPGQSSVYIPPGNTARETYRITTFKNFPPSSIHPCALAAAGFYYTGFRDRVKCYSCGGVVDDWQLQDDPSLRDWHNDDCDFINGVCTTNVPLITGRGTALMRDTRRFTAANSNTHQNRSPRQRDTSMTQSTQARVSLNPSEPSSQSQVTRHQLRETRHQPQETRLQPQETLRRGENRESSLFLCRRPINPHMRSKEARLQTFLDNSVSWPVHRIRATPQQIADAGMFYLGERDRVKCWYCNGGLQNWEQDDQPWEEHAKWFPRCEFVLQQKGANYVNQIVARFPNLRRPILSNAASHSSLSASPENSVEIIDPKEKLRKIRDQIEQDITTCEKVASVKLMGFPENCIKSALKRQYLQHKHGFRNCESLVSAVLELESFADDDDEIPSTSSGEQTSSSTSQETPLDELEELELSRRCKKCHKEVACVVFIPCGHLACCVQCADGCKKCAICHEVASEKVRSYIS